MNRQRGNGRGSGQEPFEGFRTSNRGGAQPSRGTLPIRGGGQHTRGPGPIRGGGPPRGPRVPGAPRQQGLSDPASANRCPTGGYGGVYEDSNTREKGKIYNFPNGSVPPPSTEVTEKENDNVKSNRNVTHETLQARGINIPLRTTYGTEGSESIMAANYFQVAPNSTVILWKYNLSVKRKNGPSKDLVQRQRHRLLSLLLKEQFLASHGHAVATDYNNTLITTKKIVGPGDADLVVSIKYWDVEDRAPGPNFPEYDVTISFGRTIAMQELEAYLQSAPDSPAANYNKAEAVTALNTIIVKHPHTTTGVFAVGGNRFYCYPVGKQLKDCFDLGGGLIAVRGYYASVRTSTSRILVNAHTQTSAFYPPVTARELMRLHGEKDHIALTAFLRRLRVKTSYLRSQDGKTTIEKVKTITGLSETNAETERFFNEELLKEVNVKDYFLQKYNIRLIHPQAFLLQIGTIERDRQGNTLPKSEQKPIWLPPELGSVMPGQFYAKKLSPAQTKVMLNYAARPPAENARRLVDDGLRTLGLTLDNPILNAFGLVIRPDMVTVPARQLLAPQIQYKGKPQIPKAASWNLFSMTYAIPSPTFANRKTISPWGVLQIERILFKNPAVDDSKARENATKQVAEKQQAMKGPIVAFQESLKSCGLGNHKPKFHRCIEVQEPFAPDANDRIFIDELTKAKKEGILVVIVILPTTDAVLYSRLKFLADCKVGIHTVSSQFEKFKKCDKMIYANLTLKVNSKLGGTNHHVLGNQMGFLGGDTMIVGVDVTHPSPASVKVMPSIVGVVANIDDIYAQWPGSIRLQAQYQPDPKKEVFKPREMVQDMKDMIKERLDLYAKYNKSKLPRKILVYRDGVSESQYDAVLAQEYPGIVAACRMCYPPSSMPPITIIVVGKRHHSRVYPTQEKDSDLALGRWAKGNAKPGTVVDRGITMDQGNDFFLIAHAALQGTAKPAHYVIIKDDLKRSADEYHTVTHNLCYHFARATKAVSYCPPAYYADILCERGRCYLYKYYNAHPAMQKETFDWNRSPWARSSTPHPDLAQSMFYL